jgi:hypothetical protein
VPRHVQPVIAVLRGSALENVAGALCDLQDARHTADYDHLATFSKTTVVAHIADAEAAIATLEKASERQRQAFFAVLALNASRGPT